MQAHMTKIVERYQQMVDRMRKELPRFHDETAVELGGAFRACASMQAALARDTAEIWEGIMESAHVPRIKQGRSGKLRTAPLREPGYKVPVAEVVGVQLDERLNPSDRTKPLVTHSSQRDRAHRSQRDKRSSSRRRVTQPSLPTGTYTRRIPPALCTGAPETSPFGSSLLTASPLRASAQREVRSGRRRL
jgi:hypothetical protein